MIIFQFSGQSTRRMRGEVQNLPPNFFQNVVPPESILVARNTISTFDQRYPNASAQTRDQFLNLVSRNLTHIQDPRLIYTIAEQTSQDILAQWQIHGLLCQGSLNPSSINFIDRISLVNYDLNPRFGDVATFYENLPQHAEFLERLATTSRSSVDRRTLSSLLDISHHLFVGRNTFVNHDSAEQFGSFIDQISGLNPLDRSELATITLMLTRSYGLTGLNFVEESIRRFGASADTIREIVEVEPHFRDRADQFTIENAIELLQNQTDLRSLNSQITNERAQILSVNPSEINGISLSILEVFAGLLSLSQQNRTLNQSLADARSMIHELGLDENSTELRANFAYGITVLGRERARQLYASQGIENFARYTPTTLEAVSQNINDRTVLDTRPVFYLFMNRDNADWNGAFYANSNQIERLTRGYRLIIVESPDARDFSNAAIRTAARHGQIGGWVIGGHGDPNSIQTGPDRTNENHQLDLTDANQMQVLLNRNIFHSNAVGVLISCNTGNTENQNQPIGQQISTALGRRVIAPNRPTGLHEFQFDQNNHLVGATYRQSESAVNFSGGSRSQG